MSMYTRKFIFKNIIMQRSREQIQKLVSGTVLDLGCGTDPIKGKYTIGVDLFDYLFNDLGQDIEYHIYDVQSPGFIDQEFLKRDIDYITLNALICNIITEENKKDVIHLLRSLKKKAKKNIIIGDGELIKDLLEKNSLLTKAGLVDCYENKLGIYGRAYVMIL